MNREPIIGPIQLQFRSGGHLCTMTMSGDKTLLKRISDETETFENFEVPTWIELATCGGADPEMHMRVELRDGSPNSSSCRGSPSLTRVRFVRSTFGRPTRPSW